MINKSKIIKILFISLFFSLFGCQTIKNYHDNLIETSLVCEIPTLAGNLVGSVSAAPFLIVTVPTGYVFYPDNEIEEDKNYLKKDLINDKNIRRDYILAPVYTGSYFFGMLLGTPFYPFGLIFPRNKPQESLKNDS